MRPWALFNRHVLVLLEASSLKEVRILFFISIIRLQCYIHDNTKVLIPNRKVPKSSCRTTYFIKISVLLLIRGAPLFLYKWDVSKTQNLSGSMFLLTRFLCFHNYFRWEKKHRVLGTYINNNYKIVKKNL